MAIYGEYGEIESIGCTAEPQAEVVSNGEVAVEIKRATILEDWVPANCPRQSLFNPQRQIGCVSCSHSLIDYENGIIEC